MMELRTFVAETIKGILDGIQDAKKIVVQYDGAQINPWILVDEHVKSRELIDRETKTPVRTVEFDVAVTSSETSETKGGVGVKILVFEVAGERASGATSATAHRIKFSIPMALPRASHMSS